MAAGKPGLDLYVSLSAWYLHQEPTPVGQNWCWASKLEASEQWYNTLAVAVFREYTFPWQEDRIAVPY